MVGGTRLSNGRPAVTLSGTQISLDQFRSFAGNSVLTLPTTTDKGVGLGRSSWLEQNPSH